MSLRDGCAVYEENEDSIAGSYSVIVPENLE